MNERVAYGEYRRFFKHIGLSPRVSRGFEDNVTGIDVPVYFLKDNGGFTGGVRLGWRSDTHDISASVMVGMQLRLLD